MAYSSYADLGPFAPARGNFGTDDQYNIFLRNQAKQKADYLSSMDQFHEQLQETTRQFNETLGFKEKSLLSAETLTREGWEHESEENKLNREANEKLQKWLAEQSDMITKGGYKEATLELQEQALSKNTGAVQDLSVSNKDWFDLAKSKLSVQSNVPQSSGVSYSGVSYSGSGEANVYPQQDDYTGQPYFGESSSDDSEAYDRSRYLDQWYTDLGI